MDEKEAIDALFALAQPNRMAAFRRLVAIYPDAMPAGDLAQRLNLRHNTLSSHLAALERSGFVSGTRDGRSIRYRARPEALNALVDFLTRDCCGGRPDICDPLVDTLARSSRERREEQGARHG